MFDMLHETAVYPTLSRENADIKIRELGRLKEESRIRNRLLQEVGRLEANVLGAMA